MTPLQLTTTVQGDMMGNWATTTAFMQVRDHHTRGALARPNIMCSR